MKYRGFRKRCKLLVTLKKRKTSLDFARKKWTDEYKMDLCQNDGKRKEWRRRGTDHDLKHSTSSVKHGGSNFVVWAFLVAMEPGE